MVWHCGHPIEYTRLADSTSFLNTARAMANRHQEVLDPYGSLEIRDRYNHDLHAYETFTIENKLL